MEFSNLQLLITHCTTGSSYSLNYLLETSISDTTSQYLSALVSINFYFDSSPVCRHEFEIRAWGVVEDITHFNLLIGCRTWCGTLIVCVCAFYTIGTQKCGAVSCFFEANFRATVCGCLFTFVSYTSILPCICSRCVLLFYIFSFFLKNDRL